MSMDDLLNKVREGSLQLTPIPEADVSVFIKRIRDYERKYEMSWLTFQGLFSEGKLQTENAEIRFDYSEWNMLCSEFFLQLVAEEIAPASPPPISKFPSTPERFEQSDLFFVSAA